MGPPHLPRLLARSVRQVERASYHIYISSIAPQHVHRFQPRTRNSTPSSHLPSIPNRQHPFSPSRTPHRAFSSSQSRSDLSRTPLYDLHLEHGAKMVPFGGYEMPLQYSDQSHLESHHWARNKASLFDVSHMYVNPLLTLQFHTNRTTRVQHHISGPGASKFLSTITPTSISTLAENHNTLSCLLAPETGGIVDDTVITRLGPETFYIVTNAACRDTDLEYLKTHLGLHHNRGGDAVQHLIMPPALIALQGPLAAAALVKILSPANGELNDLSTLHFGQSRELELSNITLKVLVTRGGYTGEDGFEIAIPSPGQFPDSEFKDQPVTTQINLIVQQLLEDSDVKLAGLAARDSLRLEAGMCLYGHDINLDTTPVAAGLSWIIGKERREGPAADFYGNETILPQLKTKKNGGTPPPVRRVGLTVEKGPPAREGADVVDAETGEKVGKVTSGLPSPTLGGVNIAMALVNNGYHKKGTPLMAVVRGKKRKAEVVKMPFVESKFYRG
jgi:aminomethyltransferase